MAWFSRSMAFSPSRIAVSPAACSARALSSAARAAARGDSSASSACSARMRLRHASSSVSAAWRASSDCCNDDMCTAMVAGVGRAVNRGARMCLAARCTPSYNQSSIRVAKASLLDAPLEGPPPALTGYLRRIWRPHRVILGAILCVGAALRYYGLNWDFGSGLHPDERHVTSLVQALALPTSWAQFLSPGHVSPFEPGDFAYGSLPLYLYWIAGHVAAWLGSWVPVFPHGRMLWAAASFSPAASSRPRPAS